MSNIIDIFYTEIVPEAALGKVDSDRIYYTCFETIIENKKISHFSDIVKNNRDLFLGALIITNKNEFDNVLYEYCLKARKFYNENDDKKILTLLWSNITEEDFKNPVNFIKKYISFMDNCYFNDLLFETNIGYSEILESKLSIQLKKESIYEETPYALYIKICTEWNENKELFYELPMIRFGIDNDIAYIYAIEQTKNKKQNDNDTNYQTQLHLYQKNIHRKLYKVLGNFNAENELFDNINVPENLTGISPSGLLVSSILIKLLSKYNISNIKIPCILPLRYNAKELLYKYKISVQTKKGIDIETIQDEYYKNQEENTRIQRNLSDKLLRYFRRLEAISNNIKLTGYPFELSSYSQFMIDNKIVFDNILINEITNLINPNKTK